jgi:ring-1,2-phenylacetyl-CoA epoxidase subunit PaaE
MAAQKEFEGAKSLVHVKLDGLTTAFELETDGLNILDAALDAGADVPYACKGAVCCTCKARVTEGKVAMEMNYALTQDEVEAGFVLTCQAHPLTASVVVDFDQA